MMEKIFKNIQHCVLLDDSLELTKSVKELKRLMELKQEMSQKLQISLVECLYGFLCSTKHISRLDFVIDFVYKILGKMFLNQVDLTLDYKPMLEILIKLNIPQKTKRSLVQLCSRASYFFHNLDEIANFFFPMFCQRLEKPHFYMFQLCSLFLPPKLVQQNHVQLFFIMSEQIKHCRQVDVLIFSFLTKVSMAQPNFKWPDFFPKLYCAGLRLLCLLPKQISVDLDDFVTKSIAQDERSFAHFVCFTLHFSFNLLEELVIMLRNFVHPSNMGVWTNKICLFLKSLCSCVLLRVSKSNPNHVPVEFKHLCQNKNLKIYDDSSTTFTFCSLIPKFVEIIQPLLLQCIFSKESQAQFNSQFALKMLITLQPNAIKNVLEIEFPSLEQPTRVNALFSALSMNFKHIQLNEALMFEALHLLENSSLRVASVSFLYAAVTHDALNLIDQEEFMLLFITKIINVFENEQNISSGGGDEMEFKKKVFKSNPILMTMAPWFVFDQSFKSKICCLSFVCFQKIQKNVLDYCFETLFKWILNKGDGRILLGLCLVDSKRLTQSIETIIDLCVLESQTKRIEYYCEILSYLAHLNIDGIQLSLKNHWKKFFTTSGNCKYKVITNLIVSLVNQRYSFTLEKSIPTLEEIEFAKEILNGIEEKIDGVKCIVDSKTNLITKTKIEQMIINLKTIDKDQMLKKIKIISSFFVGKKKITRAKQSYRNLKNILRNNPYSKEIPQFLCLFRECVLHLQTIEYEAKQEINPIICDFLLECAVCDFLKVRKAAQKLLFFLPISQVSEFLLQQTKHVLYLMQIPQVMEYLVYKKPLETCKLLILLSKDEKKSVIDLLPKVANLFFASKAFDVVESQIYEYLSSILNSEQHWRTKTMCLNLVSTFLRSNVPEFLINSILLHCIDEHNLIRKLARGCLSDFLVLSKTKVEYNSNYVDKQDYGWFCLPDSQQDNLSKFNNFVLDYFLKPDYFNKFSSFDDEGFCIKIQKMVSAGLKTKVLDFCPQIQQLLNQSDKSRQKTGLEWISGIIRGCKYWNNEEKEKLWSNILPIFSKSLLNCEQETKGFHVLSLRLIFKKRDPKHLFPLIQFLFSINNQSAFNQSKAFSFVATMVNCIGYRIQDRVFDFCCSLNLDNIGLVQQELANLLSECLACMYQPDFGKIQDVLKCNEFKINVSKIKELIKVISKNINLNSAKTLGHCVYYSLVHYRSQGEIVLDELLYPVCSALQSFEDTDGWNLAQKCLLFSGQFQRTNVNVENLFFDFNHWKWKIIQLGVLQNLYFKNLPLICLENRKKVVDMVVSLLSDPVPEVRTSASETLSNLIRSNDSIINHVLKVTKDLMEINLLSGIMGLSSIITAYPYSMENNVPDLLILLAKYAEQSGAIGVFVRKIFSEFKRTHAETWHIDREKLTEEQRLVISQVVVSPSYYA